MRNNRQAPASDAERQLSWSRRYLKREKRRRLARRVVPMLVFALACAVAVYAVVNGELPALPVANTPSSALPAPPSEPAPPASAQEEPALCIVTFDSRGGSAVTTPQAVARGAYLPIPAQPERDGYQFLGWYTDDTRTEAWDFAGDTVEQDTTLYAKWEALPARDTDAAMPQTGVETGVLLWAGVLAAALVLASAVALALRRARR